MTCKRLTWFTLPFVSLWLLVLLVWVPLIPLVAAAPAVPLYDCTAQSDISQSECEALVAMYNANPAANFNANWLSDLFPCGWDGVVCGIGYVDGLYLNYIQLMVVPPEIDQLTNLSFLNLSDNELTAVPPEIGQLANLDLLNLSNNELTAVPPEMGQLTNLTFLALSGNQLASLPVEMGQLTNLTYLTLSNNQLTTVPTVIGQLVNLTSLSLSNNQLTTVPPGISQLTTLTTLFLDGNQLTAVPAVISQLTSLTTLFMANNQLTAVPPEISQLTNLTDLHLYDNQLAAIPAEIGQLANLTDLWLEGNRLTAVPSEIGQLGNLTRLQLHNNQLTAVPAEIGQLGNLNYLYLNDNLLTSIPAELGQLNNLGVLWLHKNQLTAVPPEIGQLSNLRELDLSGNKLTSVSPEIGNLNISQNLFLHDNPLSGALPSFLTTLNPQAFFFYNTSWCVPHNAAIQNWLAGLATVAGTGRICGQPGGNISGQVTISNTMPVSQTAVILYRATWSWFKGEFVAATQTDAQGTYSFSELGQGIDYYVYFSPASNMLAPQYYNNQRFLDDATAVTVTLGMTITNINAVLTAPHLPLVQITTTTGSVTSDPVTGLVTVAQQRDNPSDVTVTAIVSCSDSSTPTAVHLFLESASYPMSATGNAQEYSGTIPAADVSDGMLTIFASCSGNDEGNIVGFVTLYDPSGHLTDADTGEPIAGAKVTLYQLPQWRARKSPTDTVADTCQSNLSKEPTAPWNQPAPTNLGVKVNTGVTFVSPLTSWQYSNDEGYYGWDVPAGCWYVTVEAEGYESVTSPVVGVPTAVTDLNLQLTPIEMASYIYLPILVR